MRAVVRQVKFNEYPYGRFGVILDLFIDKIQHKTRQPFLVLAKSLC